MQITSAMIKELREKTGVGMMECKKALTEADGNMEQAITLLRERGAAAAEKKSGRIAAEGMVYPFVSQSGVAVLIEVNSETDFAAKNEKFTDFVRELAAIVAEHSPADVDALSALPYGDGVSVGDEIKNKVLTIGENIKIRRFVVMEPGDGFVHLIYNHHSAGKIATLVRLGVSAGQKDNAQVLSFGKDVCMGVAVNRPEFLSKENVPAERIEHEKSILKTQVINEGKPEAIAEKIVAGRMGKFFESVCLLDQPYVREPKLSVSAFMKELSGQTGGEISVLDYACYECGEGIEKKADDFAEEVRRMAQ